ncbi:hypothetical protein DPEC_G00124150 [Dallia pectoralis]|uniref:Uncharacterized protein n=1 Tax=Dallia pectoralis TaxID=75939 RepID=A0ACC2GQW9_DALPE|nr:hypothetical protein DPEC_G00124150 [Dallia pectoralis]
MTMEKIGCRLYNSSPSQIMIGSLEESSEVLSPYQPFVIQPPTCGLALETQESHEHQTSVFRQSVINLQTKLQEVHIEKDALSDLRMKESRKQAKVIGKMQAMITELQSAAHTGHERLLEAEAEARSQARRAESSERTLQNVYSTVSAYDRHTGRCSFTIQEALEDAVERLLQDFQHENHSLRERIQQVEEQMETQKWQREAEILLKEQRERKTNKGQDSAYHHQINELEEALSILRSDLLDAQQRHEDKPVLEQREVCLSVLEQESQLKQAGLSKQSLCVVELTLEKQQLTAELELKHRHLVSTTEEYAEYKKLQSIKSEEQEGVVVSLKTHLKTTRAALDQARRTLRKLEGADSHGLKIAMGMQKQITDRRGQIDTLQGRIQILEETLGKLTEEKHYQSLENKCRIQELACVSEEKRQLAAEVETTRLLEKQLRDTVAKLETALHKMSESFVYCQDFIQLQEQEFVRLKLQHALDLKELQGLNRRTTGNAQCATMSSPKCLNSLHLTQRDFRSLQPLKHQQLLENLSPDLESLIKELQGVISENPRPHTITRSIPWRSPPERERQATLNEEANNVTSNSKTSKGTHSRTSDQDKQKHHSNSNLLSKSHDFSFAASQPGYTLSPQALVCGRRSPVHSLLTSDPNLTP